MLALQEKLQGNIEWHRDAGYMAVHAWLRLAEPSKKKKWILVRADGDDGAPDSPDTKKARLGLEPGAADSTVKCGTGSDTVVPAVPSSDSGEPLAVVPAKPTSHSPAWILVRLLDKAAP
jgi:hypothetical protein